MTVFKKMYLMDEPLFTKLMSTTSNSKDDNLVDEFVDDVFKFNGGMRGLLRTRNSS